MANSNEIAEAILLVIKRIAKWIALGILGLIVLGGLAWAGVAGYNYVTYGLPASKVKVIVTLDQAICSDPDFPVAVTILNRSERTVIRTSVHVYAHQKGHSKDLSKWGPLESDVIIPPKEGHRNCWKPRLNSDAAAGTKHQDLIWELHRFTVTFKS